jgi:DNA-binding NarL/FixJ family response regulator
VSTQRVAVLHRSNLFRDCLVNFLHGAPSIESEAVDHAALGADEVEIADQNANVFLVDLNLPDNLALRLTKYLKVSGSDKRIIILVPEDYQNLLECVAAGVHGCIMEKSSLEELIQSIGKVLSGEIVCAGPFAATIFSEIAKMNWQIPTMKPGCRLTARELEVLELLAKRCSNKQIAKQLSVSIFTVKNHVHNILEKLEVDSRVNAVDRARHENLISNF